MQSVSNVIARAEGEISAGRLWRAREIVDGNLHGRSYADWKDQPEILELYAYYGKSLVKLSDMMHGGRYLFLSGVRDEESKPSIELFVSRFGRPDPMNLFRALPKRAKLNFISLYPQSVQDDFKKLGADENLYEAAGMTRKTAPSPTPEQLEEWRQQDRFAGVMILGLLLLPWLIGSIFILWFFGSKLMSLFA